jgi:phosphoglycerate dehydrogenase-like enzyme
VSPVTVVLAGGSARGEPWIRERVPDAVIRVFPVAGDHRLPAAIVDADAVVAAELHAGETARAERLRMIHVLGAGPDGIADDAIPAGCALCNVYEHETAIGEWALMTMLALSRRLLAYDRRLREGDWQRAVFFDGEPELDIRGRRVGFVGFGNIGRNAARLALAVGMSAAAVTRTPALHVAEAERLGLAWLGGMTDLPRLLAESDFAVVCVPHVAETTGLIGAAELAQLRASSYLLNVGRGPVVDEYALYSALTEGRLAGAGIDVWYRYPENPGETTMPANLPFWELDNVVMTPHSSGWTASTLEGRWRFIAEQIASLRDGLPLRNVLRGPTNP